MASPVTGATASSSNGILMNSAGADCGYIPGQMTSLNLFNSASVALRMITSAGTLSNPSNGAIIACSSSQMASDNPSTSATLSWMAPQAGTGKVLMKVATAPQNGQVMLYTFYLNESTSSASSGACSLTSTTVTPSPLDYYVFGKADKVTVGLLGLLLALLLLSALIVRIPFFANFVEPWMKPLSVANLSAVLGIYVILIAMAIGLAGDHNLSTAVLKVPSLGFVTGLAYLCAASFSFYRLGAKDLVNMSTESQWQMHDILGFLAFVMGTVHGAYALLGYGRELIFGSNVWSAGFAAQFCVWIAVAPYFFYFFNVMRYDFFKLLHFAAPLGYYISVGHMIGNAYYVRQVGCIVLAAANFFVASLLFFQQVYVRLWKRPAAKNITLEVLPDEDCKHVVVSAKVKGFGQQPGSGWQAGQWAHLLMPGISYAPHPFTIVPGAVEDTIRFIIKVESKSKGGAFTKGLLEKAQKAEISTAVVLSASVMGPFGTPAMFASYQEVVFILGGVGVTPALSLVPACHARLAKPSPVYWSTRSESLLRYCAPMLEGCVHAEQSCVVLSSKAVQEGGSLPLQATQTKTSVRKWLKNLKNDWVAAGATGRALVFVCGPESLADATRAALRKLHSPPLAWHLHVETFCFLPSLKLERPSRKTEKDEPIEPDSPTVIGQVQRLRPSE